MPHYKLFVFAHAQADRAALSPAHESAKERYPAKVHRSIRGPAITDGPFLETKELRPRFMPE